MEPLHPSQSAALGLSSYPRRTGSVAALGLGLSLVCTTHRTLAQALPIKPEVAARQAEDLTRRQTGSPQQKQQEAAPQSDLPETYPGENADLGPQMLLKPKAAPKRKPLFEFSSDTMFTYTSNALYTGGNPTDAGIVAETFSLAFAPEPLDLAGGKLSFRTGYRHLFWAYDVTDRKRDLNALNFEMSTIFLGASYVFKENWNASLGLDYNRLLLQTDRGWSMDRLLDPSNWKEAFVEWVPSWSLSRNIPLGDKASLAVGYNGSYHFSNTDPSVAWSNTNSSDRLDSGASVNFMWSVMDKVVLIPGVRFTHSVYTHTQQAGGHRTDRTISPNLSLMISPRPWLTTRFSVGGEFRHSTDDNTPNTSKLDLGVAVTFNAKF